MPEITSRRSSDGTETPLKDYLYHHLVNAIRVEERKAGGGPSPMVDALRAELARRPPRTSGDKGAERVDSHRLEPAPAPGPADASPGHNRPPEDTPEEFRKRLEEENAEFFQLAARAEMAAGGLPRAEEITGDDHIARIDDWIKRARAVVGQAEKLREGIKAPFLRRGQAVDELFGGVKKDLAARIAGIEARKGPYLRTLATRRQAEIAAQQEADRQAAARLRQEEQAERERQAEAERTAQEAAERLANTEAERAAQESTALATAEADETPPDLSGAVALGAEVDAHEGEYREAALAADQSGERAGALASAAAEADRRADIAAEQLAGGSHVLGAAGASGLKPVWRHRIAKPVAFVRAHPLLEFFSDADIEAALKRACKADPRPDIIGVEFYQDYDVTTARR